MQRNNRATLTEGPIKTTLVKLTIPMVFGIIGFVIFNLVDTFYVGQLGTTQLAAISFTFPVVFILGSLSMGLGIGTSAIVSKAIGQGDHSTVKRLTTDSLILSLVVVFCFSILGLLTVEPLFRALGATSEELPYIKEYMHIWYLGAFFFVVPMVGNNAIRATGDTRTPSVVMLVASIANLILDPIFIFGLGPVPRLEIAGAAIATVISRILTFVVALWVLYHRERMLTFARPAMKVVLNSWRQILYIGLPAAGTNMIVPIGMGIVTALLAVHGPEAVAGFGVASRIEIFALAVFFALGSVLAPFTGQNRGAGKMSRVRIGIKYCQIFAIIWGAAMFVLFLLLGETVANLFNDDPLVVQAATAYFWLVPVSYGLHGVFMLSSAALNVLNRPIPAAILGMLRMFIIYVPLGIAGSYLYGVAGIFGAATIANAATGIASYIWLRRIVNTPAMADPVRMPGMPLSKAAAGNR